MSVDEALVERAAEVLYDWNPDETRTVDIARAVLEAVLPDLTEQARAEERERIATTLDDLALSLVVSSDSNPTGNSLTGAIVYKCAEIARQVPA